MVMAIPVAILRRSPDEILEILSRSSASPARSRSVPAGQCFAAVSLVTRRLPGSERSLPIARSYLTETARNRGCSIRRISFLMQMGEWAKVSCVLGRFLRGCGAEGQNPERGYCLLLDGSVCPYFVRRYALLRLRKIGPL